MTRSQFSAAVLALLNKKIEETDWEEKLSLMRHVATKADREEDHDEGNKGKPWSDDELRAILRTAPTRDNCMMLARAFKRGFGSIEQILRWAATKDKTIETKRSEDVFVQQIRRIKHEVGWIAD